MKYRVVFAYDDDVWRNRMAIAENKQAIIAWYRMYEPEARIVDIFPPVADMVPDKPCIEIPVDYFPYVYATGEMSVILQREKGGMTCSFLVMDAQSYEKLDLLSTSADNRGNQLVVGDWYVIVTCSNGYKYYVNVTNDSVITMCAEVFGFIQYK